MLQQLNLNHKMLSIPDVAALVALRRATETDEALY